MDNHARHWLTALLLAMGLHLALAVVLQRPAPIILPDPGMRILLGAGGGEPSTDSVSPADSPEAVSAVAPEPVQAVEAIEPPPLPAVEPPPPAVAPLPDLPTLVATSEPEPVQPPPPMETVQAREPPPKPKPRPRLTNPRPAPAPAVAEAAPAAPPSRPAADAPGALSPSAPSPGGPAGAPTAAPAMDSYYARLAAWLERHKHYPRQAQRRRQEGVVKLRFVMDRQGQVLTAQVLHSSGYSALDEAARDMLRRAEPLPPLPPELTQARLEIVVPVAFDLR